MSIASSVKELPGWFARTKVGQEAVAEANAKTESERIEHAESLRDIRTQEGTDGKPLRAAVEKARRKLQDLHGKHNIARSSGQTVRERANWTGSIAKAEADTFEAEQKLTHVTGTADAAASVHEDFLAANRPESIQTFHAELERLIAAAMDSQFVLHRSEPTGGMNLNTMKPIVEESSNAAARNQRLDDLRELRTDNRDTFWLMPWTVEQLEAEQAKRLAEIPDGRELA